MLMFVFPLLPSADTVGTLMKDLANVLRQMAALLDTTWVRTCGLRITKDSSTAYQAKLEIQAEAQKFSF